MSSTTKTTSTKYAVSADGTRIAYETRGTGPALVVVEGAMCTRTMGSYKILAPALEDRFTVVGYDRRGRGESSDTRPYEVQREVEDLAAVLEAVGEAYVFGASSGAALALEAARQGIGMRRLAVYEAPFIVDDTHADPSRSPASATRKFCTPAPAATTNISRSAASRRASP